MTDEPTNKWFGTPMSEWIRRVPNELDVDAVGLWQIIPVGRNDFGLEGDALKDFARRCIIGLLEAGAVPVEASAKEGIFWEEQTQYGSTFEEIADNVLLEWDNSGADPEVGEGLWFSTRSGNRNRKAGHSG